MLIYFGMIYKHETLRFLIKTKQKEEALKTISLIYSREPNHQSIYESLRAVIELEEK